MKINSTLDVNAHAESPRPSVLWRITGREAHGLSTNRSPTRAPISGISRATTNTPVTSKGTPPPSAVTIVGGAAI